MLYNSVRRREAVVGRNGTFLTLNRLSNGDKMVLPFERQPLLHKRYASLSSPELTRFSLKVKAAMRLEETNMRIFSSKRIFVYARIVRVVYN